MYKLCARERLFLCVYSFELLLLSEINIPYNNFDVTTRIEYIRPSHHYDELCSVFRISREVC